MLRAKTGLIQPHLRKHREVLVSRTGTGAEKKAMIQSAASKNIKAQQLSLSKVENSIPPMQPCLLRSEYARERNSSRGLEHFVRQAQCSIDFDRDFVHASIRAPWLRPALLRLTRCRGSVVLQGLSGAAAIPCVSKGAPQPNYRSPWPGLVRRPRAVHRRRGQLREELLALEYYATSWRE